MSNQHDPSNFVLDPELEEYCTPKQLEKLKAWQEHGSQRKAGKALGISPANLNIAYRAVLKKAGQHGYAPDRDLTHKTAPGMSSKGTSIRYDEDGKVQQYWNKSKQEGRDPEEVVRLPDPKTITKLSTLYDQEGNVTQQWIAEKPEAIAQVEAWREFAKALSEPLPRAELIPPPVSSDQDLAVCYPVGDHHMGMLAWPEETGRAWDINIGERMLAGATDYLVSKAPDAAKALIVFLGDFMHYDSMEPVTPTSRNQLDADSRFPKMVRGAIRAMRHMIERALEKHEHVYVIVEIGNHDLSSSIFLMELLANTYEKEPRITIDTSPMHFHYWRFGKVLIGSHHGHGAKMPQLPLIMATDRKEDWGETEYRYWLTGHMHTLKTQVAIGAQDFSGCTVEQFRVLAPGDAWATQKGYRAISDMKAIVYDRRYGEVSRNTVNPKMFSGED